VGDSSYNVAGACMKGLTDLQPEKSYELAKKYGKNAKGALGKICNETLIKKGTEVDFDYISNYFDQLPMNDEKFSMLNTFKSYVLKLENENNIRSAIDMILNFRNQIPGQYREYVDAMFEKALQEIGKAKSEEIRKYIEEKLK
jgi:hypothetical protein